MERILPEFTNDLIKELNTEFPEQNPSPSDTEKDIMYRAGQRSVIF